MKGPTSVPPPLPPPPRKPLYVLKPGVRIPKKLWRSPNDDPNIVSRRRYVPYRPRRAPTITRGAKLADYDAALSPDKPRSGSPAAAPVCMPSPPAFVAPPALPGLAGGGPDFSDPKLFRRLPRSWFKYRVLPKSLQGGAAAAGTSVAAPAAEAAWPNLALSGDMQ